MGSWGHYPYPLDEKGKPVDTPEFRDPDDVAPHAPKPHEKGAPDNALLKAIRTFETGGMAGVEAALAEGIDVNAADKLGFTPLHLALKSKNVKVANKLLQVEGINLNAVTRKGFTPLMMAAWKGDVDLVKVLIEKGADMKIKTEDGRNVWGVANDHHRENIQELLKKHDFHYAEGDTLAFPPHPKWKPENRDKDIDWDAPPPKK